MPTHLDQVRAFEIIEAWANEARNSIKTKRKRYSPPPLEALIDALSGKFFLTARIGKLDEQGRALISLKVSGPKKSDPPVIRYMLPVHAAMTRAFELAGANVKLIRGSGGGIEKFYFDLKIDKFRTNLHRAMFGMISSGRLWERPDLYQGYRYVVPANYLAGVGFTRRDMLNAISEKLEKRSPKSLIAEPQAVNSLLNTLFALADYWHWDELEGRPAASESERFTL